MENKRDSKKRDAPHEVQKTGLDQSNVIQEANTSLNSNKENENDKDIAWKQKTRLSTCLEYAKRLYTRAPG